MDCTWYEVDPVYIPIVLFSLFCRGLLDFSSKATSFRFLSNSEAILKTQTQKIAHLEGSSATFSEIDLFESDQ
jgi:hypothetical protein